MAVASSVLEPVLVWPTLPPARLTTLVRDSLCDGCGWPDVCAHDRTCWDEERSQPWVRPVLNLGLLAGRRKARG